MRRRSQSSGMEEAIIRFSSVRVREDLLIRSVMEEDRELSPWPEV